MGNVFVEFLASGFFHYVIVPGGVVIAILLVLAFIFTKAEDWMSR